MNVEYVVGIAVAIALGVVNISIKVYEKMGKKNGNSKRYPCDQHASQLKEVRIDVDEIQKDFHGFCLTLTERLTRQETLLGTVIQKLDKINGSGG